MEALAGEFRQNISTGGVLLHARPAREGGLPSPPSDIERDLYFRRRLTPLLSLGALGMTGIVYATVRMALSHPGLHVYLGVAGLMALFFLVTFRTNFLTRDECAAGHRRLVESWRPERAPSIDVWLPIAGETLDVLENTWSHVSRLDWDGVLRFHVGDDGESEEAEELAGRFGFSYSRRPNPGWMKKAGNLRHLYLESSAEFAVIFDADFCPRPDFLQELMPYFDDERIGIVQSPQFFRVRPRQNWLERGAGAVQELFYRAIQVSRQRHDGAVCVGTNAIYRRRALDDNGGTTLIGHSEDVHTGFDLFRRGWRLRYVPVNLATGLCPDRLHSFMRQQYRWCMGSMSLLGSRKFWATRMPLATRCCYLAGFGYYLSTALNTLIVPLLPIVLLVAYPKMVHLDNYLILAPALLYAYLAFPLWHRCKWGLEAWSVQMVYGWSHLFALTDVLRRRPMGWTPSGAGPNGDRRAIAFRSAIVIWSGGISALWVGMALWRWRERHLDFLPMLGLGLFYLMVVVQTFIPLERRPA
jgi:cellulose synthase (UDP-forming)